MDGGVGSRPAATTAAGVAPTPAPINAGALAHFMDAVENQQR